MSGDLRMASAGIPIVGRAFEIVKSYPTVVIQCQCEAGDIIVLIGKRAPQMCRGCQKTYAIADAGPVSVGLVAPKPMGVPV